MSKNTAATELKELTKAKPELNGNEVKVLTALSKATEPMTRADLRKKTGIPKGYSRMLGATTKPGLGASGKASLQGRGLVKGEAKEGVGLVYAITAAGKRALEAVTA